VVRFVELAENLSFRDAVERIGASAGTFAARQLVPPLRVRPTVAVDDRNEDELIALRAATSLYHHRLLTDPEALAYVTRRGLDRTTVESCRLGYASGEELAHHLRWLRLPLGPAMRVGLLTYAGREFMAGRIVVPELRDGLPVWLVGRLLEPASPAAPEGDAPPKYLALRGSKPLLGAENVRGSATVIVTEGVFDFLTLRHWGYPVVALVGTHTRPDLLDQLREFQRLYVVLDQDDAGLEATFRLVESIGPRAIPVALPDDVKDVAELGPRPDGPALFAAALLEAVGGLEASSA
jgi:DNA primase